MLARENKRLAEDAKREIMAKVVPRFNPDDVKTTPGTCGELDLQLEWHRMRGDKEVPKKTHVGRKDQKIEALIAAIERHNAGTQCNSAETASQNSGNDSDNPTELEDDDSDMDL